MSTHTISLTDSIYIRRSPTDYRIQRDKRPRELLIYFIPGNPGLIQYYHDFLTHLASLLDPDKTNFAYHVVGHSLGGFELQGNASGSSQLEATIAGFGRRAKGHSCYHAYDLTKEQLNVMDGVEQTSTLIRRQNSAHERFDAEETEPLYVVLMGHSVGAYLMMQTVMFRQLAQSNVSPSPLDRTTRHVGAIGLFPTLVNLAGSPRGQKLAPLGTQRWFAPLVQFLAFFLRLIPPFIVRHLVKYITGQPWKAAETTTAFLRSKYGVYQALYLARSELLEIDVDDWSDTLWNRNEAIRLPTPAQVDRPHLYFFWGDNDPWVQNSTRDKMISKHTRRVDGSRHDGHGAPYMEVDRSGIPHAFCIQPEHSKQVAEKVAELLRDVTENL